MAKVKAAARQLNNTEFRSDAQSLSFADQTIASAVHVHVLYTLPDPKQLLRQLHHWLKPGSPVFACDLGRIMDVSEWRRHLVLEIARKHGWLKALQTLWLGRGVARANQHIAASQRSGRYWMHDGMEFAAVFRDAGFVVEHQETAYRGYSDLIIARA